MEDFVGQTYDAVHAKLDGYGIRIVEKNEIAPQTSGTIIRQDPVAGEPFATTVTFWVAVPAPPVPDVVGKTIGEALTQLEGLGFTVVQKRVVSEGKPDGTVTGQDPAAGSENVGEVTLSVAREPELSYLAERDFLSISSGCSVDQEAMEGNGELYSRAMGVACPYSSNRVAEIEYDLSRDYQRLSSAVALSNSSNSNGVVKIEIFGDDRLLASTQVKFGQTSSIDAEVTGVLRLRVRVAFSDAHITLVMGDPEIQGFPEQSTPSSSGTS